MRLFRVFILLLTATLFMFTSLATAQIRSITWEIWDVSIYNIDTVNNSFDVREAYQIRFEGTFSVGVTSIQQTNLEEIRHIQVYESGIPLDQSCSEQLGTYCVTLTSEGWLIEYNFFEPITDAVQSFEIRYQVIGAVRVYDGGDQIWWTAIPEDHFGFPIESSIVTVRMPPGLAPRSGIDPVMTYGATTSVSVFNELIVAQATSHISGQESLEIRVQFPHSPNARKPEWQAEFDLERQSSESP